MNDLPSRPAPPAGTATIRCANCGTPGAGRYCGSCGQRLDVHLHSVGHFASEAAEVLTHSDSSLWKTLWPLLTRPGFLTKEFIAGRRARYLQPFRLYLVASVLLLAVTSLTGGHEPKAAAPAPAAAGPAPSAPASSAPAPVAPTTVASTTAAPASATAPAASARDADAADDAGAGNVLDLKPTDCSHVRTDARWMLPFIPALSAACRSMIADDGREMSRALVHNAGRAMFVFLPLLAAFMKLLYWRPRRYYLEHLLLLLHNHAFVYLFFAVLALLLHWLASGWIASLLVTGALLYCVRYLFVSMRAYYGQGRALTFAKFTLLAGGYCVAGLAMFLLTAFVTAVTL